MLFVLQNYVENTNGGLRLNRNNTGNQKETLFHLYGTLQGKNIWKIWHSRDI